MDLPITQLEDRYKFPEKVESVKLFETITLQGVGVLKFEDLDVWKRSAALCAEIYKELSDLKDFGYRDQITRSSLSISSNVAEGFERQGKKEFINFLNYAKGSTGELRSQVYIGTL